MLALGISLGDVAGIGPEVALKAAFAEADSSLSLVLIGDAGTIDAEAKAQALARPIAVWPGRAQATPGVWQLNPPGLTLSAGLKAGAPEAARAALAWLSEAARLCQSGELDGMVTAPLNKQAVLRTGEPFVGQTEFLTALAGGPPTAMLLLGHDDRNRWLRVALATTHLPLRLVPDALTIAGVAETIRLAALACGQLRLSRQRVGVGGLNPHAGEGGQVGREELDVIQPAIEAARASGVDAHGPFAADTLFHQALRGDYDVVVAMYHDQGLAPLKLIAFDNGVNWTVGLPFVRTSPDHGTAYEIAGRGLADASSMRAALRLAVTLASHRQPV